MRPRTSLIWVFSLFLFVGQAAAVDGDLGFIVGNLRDDSTGRSVAPGTVTFHESDDAKRLCPSTPYTRSVECWPAQHTLRMSNSGFQGQFRMTYPDRRSIGMQCVIAITVSAPGFTTETACITSTMQAGGPGIGPGLAVANMRLVPPASAKISGRVLEGAAAVPGTVVQIGGYRGASLATGADGGYEWMVAPDRQYTITPANPQFTFDPPSVTLTPTGDQTADFRAIRNTYAISGQVFAADGGPARAATVSLEAGPYSAVAAVDSSGTYVFPSIPFDTAYTLSAASPGSNFLPQTSSGTVAQPVHATFCEAISEVHTWWNTFLGMENIVEILNASSRASCVYLELLHDSGEALPTASALLIPPSRQQDVPLNQLFPMVRDRYGMVKIYSNLSRLEGRATLYKPGSRGIENPDFAITAPFPAQIRGRSYVPFSLIHVSTDELSPEVANWLSIGNPAADPKTFRINLYSHFGRLIGSSVKTIPARGRNDFEPSRTAPGAVPTGLIEVLPDDESTSYIALLTRFGQTSPAAHHGFAAALALAQGHIGEFTVPIIHIPGALNFIELSNTSESDVDVSARWYDHEGEYLGQMRRQLAPHQVIRESAGAPLPIGTSGSVIINADVSGAVIGHSVVYHRDPATWHISAADFSAAGGYPGVRLRGSFNTFLGQQNLLRVINTSEYERRIAISTTRDSSQSNPVTVSLAPHARFDMNLNTSAELVAPGEPTYGMVLIRGLNGPVFAEILRARYDINGLVDFTYATPMRESN